MGQLEHIEANEKRLWSAADNLRANSTYASNDYFLPVMGLVFCHQSDPGNRKQARTLCLPWFPIFVDRLDITQHQMFKILDVMS